MILAAVNEERLCRIKQVKGYPEGSVRTVLELSGTDPRGLDVVAVGGRNGFYQEGLHPQDTWLTWEENAGLGGRAKRWAGKLSRFRERLPFLENVYYLLQEPAYRARRSAIREALREQLGTDVPIRFVDHHFAHVASAYYTSGFDQALVISLDGGGDGRSGMVCVGEDSRLSVLHGVPAFHSLGNWYSYITHLCGFQAHRHEGKITGLAARGEPRYLDLLHEFVGRDGGTFVNRSGLVFREAIAELDRRLPDGWTLPDLAASVQTLFEREICGFVRYWARETGQRDLALAGGVAANVRVNQELWELPEIRSVFVYPAMSDAGLGAGAALAACDGRDFDRPMTRSSEALPHVYLGPEPEESELTSVLRREGLSPEARSEDPAEEIAALVAEGHTVAIASGPLEYGPRALGNRSILYQPTDPSVMDWLNEKLDRTEFMPFAPAILWERRQRCFTELDGAAHSAQFMTIALDATPWMRQRMPGVVHVDGTARPQFVRKETNPFFHRVLEAYERRTGLPGMVNTSFNRHGEPIVSGPRDAVKSFLESELDYLYVGERLIRHPRLREEREQSAAV